MTSRCSRTNSTQLFTGILSRPAPIQSGSVIGLLATTINRIFCHEMMWYMCHGLFHIGFEVDFFVLLVKQLLGSLSSYITSFRPKFPILLANKPVIVPLSIGAGRPVP